MYEFKGFYMRLNFFKKVIILFTMLCVVNINAYSKPLNLNNNNLIQSINFNEKMNHEKMNHEKMNHDELEHTGKKKCNKDKGCLNCKSKNCINMDCSKCKSCYSSSIIPTYIANSYNNLNQNKFNFISIKINPIYFSIYIPPQ